MQLAQGHTKSLWPPPSSEETPHYWQDGAQRGKNPWRRDGAGASEGSAQLRAEPVPWARLGPGGGAGSQWWCWAPVVVAAVPAGTHVAGGSKTQQGKGLLRCGQANTAALKLQIVVLCAKLFI